MREYLIGVFSVYVVFNTFNTRLLKVLRRDLDKIGDGGLWVVRSSMTTPFDGSGGDFVTYC